MERNLYVWLFATVLVVGSAASLLATPTVGTGPPDPVTDAASAIADGRITDVSYEGDGAVGSFDDSLALWQSADHTFDVTVASEAGLQEGTVCLSTGDTDTGLGCTDVSVPGNGNRTTEVAIGNWPANHTGTRSLEIDVRAVNESGSLDSRAVPTTVIRRDGDLDGDGISDYAEVERYETDPTKVDTDEDGLPDPRELELGTNPNKADTDGDGLDDGTEVNEYETDPNAADSDGDGVSDPEAVAETSDDRMPLFLAGLTGIVVAAVAVAGFLA